MNKSLVIPKCIPPLLKEQARWCCWRPVEKADGNIDRQPLGCNGTVARCNDASTCTTLAEAFEFYRSSTEAGGLNFLPGGDGDLVPAVFDFDGCVDDDGCISPAAQRVLEAIGDTYTEYSPSGHGLHAWVLAPRSTRNLAKPAEGFEFYAGRHFMSVTGNALEPGRPAVLVEIAAGRPAELLALFRSEPAEQPAPEPAAVEPELGQPEIEPGDEPAGRDERHPLVQAAERCIDRLAAWRAEDYQAWVQVMCALQGVQDESGQDMRPTWHAFSERCGDKYDREETDAKWDSYLPPDGERLTLGSLIHWACEDSGCTKEELTGTCTFKTRSAGGKKDLQFITCRELDGGDYSVEYLIEGMLVADQPAILIGPQKALKTSVLVDLAISLSTREPFLGRFPIHRAVRVGLCSGESGLGNLQDTARRVCRAKQIALADNADLLWTEQLPIFGDDEWMRILETKIRENGLQLLCVDPAYLSMATLHDSAGNFFVVGPLLRSVNEVVRGAGCQLLIAHHIPPSKMHYNPPALTDAAWAGWSEWARQWVLLNRRKAYDSDTPGEHALWASFGGSAGHSALWAIDVQEGRQTDAGGRRWDVQIFSRAEVIETEKASRQETKEQQEVEAAERRRQLVLEIFRKHPDGLTERQGRDLPGLNQANFAKAVDALLGDEIDRAVPHPSSNK